MSSMKRKVKGPFNLFSFFIGAGVLDLGFEASGIKTMMTDGVISRETMQNAVVLTMMKEGV